MKSAIKTAYLAADGFQDQLIQELNGIQAVHGHLILTAQPLQKTFWAQNVWLNPVAIAVRSISDAANQLKSMQRNWWLYSFHLHRRARLIREQLPHISAKPLHFPSSLPKTPLGSWTLLDQNTILASAQCSSLFPNGEIHFAEDKKEPPNRAYLKLWEALTLAGDHPRPGQFCIDAGASPGGWTWVAQKLGARVLSIDRSPLAPAVSQLPGVTFHKGDAFSLTPDEFRGPGKKIDWLFSDVVCYPEKLCQWVRMWVESGVCRNFICTLKFQGDGDYAIAEKFAALPDSRVLHLFHNKHELTWICLKHPQ